MTFLWQPCTGGARILRVLGDSPCPVIPEEIDGLPVTELGPYCFAVHPVEEGRIWPVGSEENHEVTGEFLEEAILPDTLRVLHSAAFYNCRKLRRIEVGPNLESLGSDLFTNCRALRTFALRASPAAGTGLKKLLGAVSADIEVEFLDAPGVRLFYPEYFELLDENTPAHIFNRSIEGEGYRMRQCFAGSAVDYAAYDATFAQACVGESEDKLCRLALGRLLFPFALQDNARTDYEFYLTAHPAAAFGWAIRERNEAALRLLAGLGLAVRDAASQCARAGWSAGAAILLARPKRAAKQYDFDDL
ncbi:leucine-rich repeat protein [Gemmiger formicilis]|uniref:leucine-rich repeat protein n=1 Tax=Gemmiger formicilis TaxID=745368 RepID=UPI00195E6239|nr:leucine-rich repeat protein [Gemmiger formicilis]MBM6898502.1 leucine-rich repeat protein [Gemmiger formicilis]